LSEEEDLQEMWPIRIKGRGIGTGTQSRPLGTVQWKVISNQGTLNSHCQCPE